MLTGWVKVIDIDLYNTSIKVFGKGQKERIVYYNEVVVNLLNQYLKIYPELNKKHLPYLFLTAFTVESCKFKHK